MTLPAERGARGHLGLKPEAAIRGEQTSVHSLEKPREERGADPPEKHASTTCVQAGSPAFLEGLSR